MSFQYHQLDKITDFDRAMDILETEYIPELLDIFGDSPEGQGYLAEHPDALVPEGWVGNMLVFGYSYLGVPLPKLKVRDMQEILLQLFPKKLSLLDPEDAAYAVPELLAFWTFMQREYQHRHSQKILEFLHQIQPTFKDTMNDPSNFGFAKAFMMSGIEAGYDMTNPEDVAAYQEQYNQQVRASGGPPPGFPDLPIPDTARAAMTQNPLAAYPIPEGVPPEFVALLSQTMGYGQYPGLEHLSSDPNILVEAIARHLVESGEVELTEEQDIDEGLGEDVPPDIELPAEVITCLEQLTITEIEPGTIIKDFEVLVNALGEKGIPVSGKLNHLPLKELSALNEKLSHPIQIDMKRPQQKSYPHLHGLYLLLRATGIAQLDTVGKKSYLKLDPEILASWQGLNPTEKYFTLLEAWVIRGDSELLGERRGAWTEGLIVFRDWSLRLVKPQTFCKYSDQDNLSYFPGLHNLALMEMFGLVKVTHGKPDAGKGWRVKKVEPLAPGNAIAQVIFAHHPQDFLSWGLQLDFTQPWGELQSYFQPYFPEWQQNLAAIAPPEHQVGTYIFKVSLGNIWRRLAISSEATLESLAYLIRESVDFDSDHLDQFSFKNPMGTTTRIFHPYCNEGPFSDEVMVGDLSLKPGMSMTYLFDFGDCWEFNVVLEEIQPERPESDTFQILEIHGEAPEQYPSWDDDWDIE